MGLVCRVVEASGIPTVYIATGRDLTALVKPPRALFVNHPMGNNFGAPFDREQQQRILRAALELAQTATVGGSLLDYADSWPRDFAFDPGAAAAMVKGE